MDEDGDLAVAFGRRVHLYAPASCRPVTGLAADQLSSSGEHSGGAGSGSGSGGDEQGGESLTFQPFSLLRCVCVWREGGGVVGGGAGAVGNEQGGH